MKVIVPIARYLLGFIFLVVGADKLYHFIPAEPVFTGVAGQFMGAMTATGYMYMVGVCQAVSGLLLLINRYVALALVVLAAVIVNINAMNFLMAQHGAGVAIGLLVALLWLPVAYRNRSALLPLLKARVAE